MKPILNKKVLENYQMIKAIEMMLNSANNLASISSELRLKTAMKLYGEHNFKLSSNQETSILLDLSCIAFPKNSSIVEHFNKL